ncbi:MAG: FkbM family methyltransferase [Holosporaceae bacterium]|jgi:FkbM family methyltransferase|nr:FkbM family methyltransferase [Holosporaceae bacterium]
MSRFCKILFLSAVTAIHLDLAVCAETETEGAPAYDKTVPLIGWDRYSGDSASSAKEWGRWWKYLRLKKPVVMKWMDDLVLRIYPGNEICRALFVRGIYNPNVAVVISKLLPSGGTFIDVGANMGYVSLLASKVVGREGRIFALEPSSRDFARLSDNVAINNLNQVISPRRLAICEKNGTAHLIISSEERNALNTLGSEISCKGVEKETTEEVETSTLDAFVEGEGGKIARIDVIQLDIEGSEVKALLGARNAIEKYRPALIISANRSALKSCNTDCGELQKTIDEMGYRVYRMAEEPVFALELVSDLSQTKPGIIVCLHKSSEVPVLPQPEEFSILTRISRFFSR